ncbi:NusA-like transcription termination signal-binding factor [Candidatus Woesearchaeota archaeon]|nr:MAG: NusA-like transcription termination signal-binding factor [Candidatus Woesearchaeota archaeon]
MARIKFDTQLLQVMSLFQKITRTTLKDAIPNGDKGQIVFVVQAGQLSRAVGKKGANVKLLESKLNRKIKIVEFNPQLIPFVRGVIYPLKAENIEEEDGVVTITPPDSKTRGLLIGRNAQNLRRTESIVKRYFNIKELRVK